MRLGVLAFLFGILFCQTLSSIPDIAWTILFLPLIFLAWNLPTYRLLFLFALGLLWTVWRADMILAQKLPKHLEGREITLNGQIIDLPEQHPYGWRFHFAPTPSEEWLNPGHLRLSWYGTPPQNLHPGQYWQLTVRLKQAHGMLNPGGFDYAKWLFQQRILATGYVRQKAEQRLLNKASPFNIDNIRYHLAEDIKTTLEYSPTKGIILALALGTKQAISQQQKKILQQTGTAHLVAISGLHIGFIAWLVFWIARRFYASKMTLWLPSPIFAALLSFSAAFAYALLAGFSLPTQRALIMVAVVMSGIVFARNVAISHILAFTLLLILLWNPLSVLSAGFWLSFGAVTIIIYVFNGKREPKLSPLAKWGTNVWKIQWALSLGMFPIILFIFGYVPLSSPLANVIAIPWISFVVVPLTLLGTAIISFLPSLASTLLHIAAYTLEALWVSIEFLAELGVWQLAAPPLWTIIVAMIGIAILLLPRGFPARWLGIIWLLPVFFIPPFYPKRGEVWLNLLDVGQGLAAIIRTENYVLVYDAGPKFRSGFNTGEAVVVPFLRANGIWQIDKLLISHGDNDHSGGAQSILENLSVDEILTSSPQLFKNSRLCQMGQYWRWDDVDFQILHPKHITHQKSNNKSCVLKVTTTGGGILLPGDIEEAVEYQLIKRNSKELKADILIAPHHGSGTSSTTGFIEAVQPTIVLFSTGYRNRFGHPKKSVVQRYRQRDIKIWNTAQVGAIEFQLSAHGISEPVLVKPRYWHFLSDSDARQSR